jgi:hypothetical protein
MRGHEAIIAMRQRRQAPAIVWVGDKGDENWHRYSDASACVVINNSERLEQLDLRWGVGLNLRMSFPSGGRAQAAFDAFCKVKPQRVICTAFEQTTKHGRPDFEVVEMMDSDGVITWRK